MKNDERNDLCQKIYALEVAVNDLRACLDEPRVLKDQDAVDDILSAVDHAITELQGIR